MVLQNIKFNLKHLLSLVLILSLSQFDAYGQDKKSRVRVSLDYETINNSDKQIHATVKAKIGRSYKGVEGIDVAFDVKAKDTLINLGQSLTDSNGTASLALDSNTLDALNSGAYTFTAKALENDAYLSKSNSIDIKDSKLELSFTQKDSLNIVDVQFMAKDSSNQFAGVSGVSVKLYVKRLFGNLPIESNYRSSDDSGKISLEFPADIKGDEEGNIVIIAQVENTNDYGSVRSSNNVSWGVPLVIDSYETKRELWTARANTPIYLLLFVNAMIIGVWGTIIYLVLQIFKIRKLGKIAEETI
jgi:hypothetical protein